MPSLKEVRTRITSIKSTQQITSAMKMVAASKLRKAQNAILQMRPYAAKLREILRNISNSLEDSDGSAYSQFREPGRVLLVIHSSNRGLCGAFNTNVIKNAQGLIGEKYSRQLQSGGLSIICVGKKASEFFTRRKYPVVGSFNSLFDNLTFDKAAVLAETLMKDYVSGKYDRIEIVYNQFKNASVQRLVVEQFLPVEPPMKTGEKETSRSNYLFQPDMKEIIREIIPKTLKVQFYKTLLDSFASEHGARMTAMHQATDNAQELMKELMLTYNKARQAAITKEILEIVSGAEALKG
jgi:F-type H+-transporting ATPase subunit gamma